jgi:hypothetical protein
VSQRRIAGHFRHRFTIGANNRTAARVRFGDGPTEAFESRWKKERGCAVVKRFK